MPEKRRGIGPYSDRWGDLLWKEYLEMDTGEMKKDIDMDRLILDLWEISDEMDPFITQCNDKVLYRLYETHSEMLNLLVKAKDLQLPRMPTWFNRCIADCLKGKMFKTQEDAQRGFAECVEKCKR